MINSGAATLVLILMLISTNLCCSPKGPPMSHTNTTTIIWKLRYSLSCSSARAQSPIQKRKILGFSSPTVDDYTSELGLIFSIKPAPGHVEAA
uniref:Secreted protein n=1 Tax=Romanomermis culicivorax TaxID=13658 RepID=A0A915L469_ROMCU